MEIESWAHFGEARVIKTLESEFKLIGGSDGNWNDAPDWMAPFRPVSELEIVPEYSRVWHRQINCVRKDFEGGQ